MSRKNPYTVSPDLSDNEENETSSSPAGRGGVNADFEYNNNPHAASGVIPVSAEDPEGETAQHRNPEICVDGNATALYGDPTHPDLDRRFVSQGWKDWIFTIAFLANVFIVFVLGCVWFAKGTKETTKANVHVTGHNDTSEFVGDIEKGTGVTVAFIVPLLAALFYLMVNSVKWFIYLGTAATSLALFIVSFILMASGNVGVGIVNLLFSVIFMVWAYFFRHHIDLAVILIEIGVNIVQRFHQLLYVAISVIVVSGLWLIFFFGVFIPVSHDVSVSFMAAAAEVFLMLWLICNVYWFVQVATNVVATASCGVAATCYYSQNGLKSSEHIPERAVYLCTKRALTTSFGSIAFGSLLVAGVRTLRFIVNQLKLFCMNKCCAPVINFLTGALEWLLRRFSWLAFASISIYGTPFNESSVKTYNLVQRNQWSEMINDDIVSAVFSVVTIVSSFFVATICTVIFGAHGAVWFSSFIVSVFACIVVFKPIEASCTALLVCICEDESKLHQHDPSLKEKIEKAILLAQQNPCEWADSSLDGQQQQQQPQQNDSNAAPTVIAPQGEM